MAEAFSNSREAKDAGWFSRRHKTSEAHLASSKDRAQERRERAIDRQIAREARTDEEQLKVLADRGVTRGREVDRLKARIF